VSCLASYVEAPIIRAAERNSEGLGTKTRRHGGEMGDGDRIPELQEFGLRPPSPPRACVSLCSYEQLLGSLCCELDRVCLALGLTAEGDLVAFERATVVENDFAAATLLFLFEFDRVALNRPFFDRDFSAAAAGYRAGQLVTFSLQREGHILRAPLCGDFGGPFPVDGTLGESSEGESEQTDQKHADFQFHEFPPWLR